MLLMQRYTTLCVYINMEWWVIGEPNKPAINNIKPCFLFLSTVKRYTETNYYKNIHAQPHIISTFIHIYVVLVFFFLGHFKKKHFLIFYSQRRPLVKCSATLIPTYFQAIKFLRRHILHCHRKEDLIKPNLIQSNLTRCFSIEENLFWKKGTPNKV